MKRYIALFLIAASLSACKKNVEEDCSCPVPPAPAPASASNYFKLQVGNYWIYDQYTIDTNNIETLTSHDSAYVWGDTVINGKMYYKLFDHYATRIVRDSAGYIIDSGGYIHFTNAIFNMPVSFTFYGNNVGYSESMTLSTTVPVTVPAGSFTAYDWLTTVHLTDPDYPWAPVRYAHDYYADGIGKVKEIYLFVSSPYRYERRLHHYHIQ